VVLVWGAGQRCVGTMGRKMIQQCGRKCTKIYVALTCHLLHHPSTWAQFIRSHSLPPDGLLKRANQQPISLTARRTTPATAALCGLSVTSLVSV
jgi:hypothetical protein